MIVMGKKKEKNKFVIICHTFVLSRYHFECITTISYFGPKGKRSYTKQIRLASCYDKTIFLKVSHDGKFQRVKEGIRAIS